MEEIEVKILEIDRKKVEQKLISLGAQKVFDGEMQTYFFDKPDRSLREQRITLRVRTEGKKTMLTIKTLVENSVSSAAKRRNETEVEVSDFEKTRQLLEALGFLVDLEMKKRRISYQLSGVHFEIDRYLGEYDYIPEFLEIEAQDEKTIFKYVKLLGFTKEECKPWSWKELVEKYGRN